MVTVVPPVLGPDVGEMLLTIGAVSDIETDAHADLLKSITALNPK
jgi:hypothetical protein